MPPNRLPVPQAQPVFLFLIHQKEIDTMRLLPQLARRAAAPLLIALLAAQTAWAAEPVIDQSVVSVTQSAWSAAGNEHFTGEVALRNAFSQSQPARVYGAYVRFSPAARTFWHRHPMGQTLIVTEGIGLTQSVDSNGRLGPVIEIKAGDVITCPPGILHWHGASKHSSMTHLAISEREAAKAVQWGKPVTDEEYEGRKNTK